MKYDSTIIPTLDCINTLYNFISTFIYVKESYSSGTSWYRIWSDGWIEQGGVVSVKGGTTTTVNLSKPYKNINYSIIQNWTRLTSGGHNFDDVNMSCSKTNKSFGIYAGETGSGDPRTVHVNWYTCGF